ncbi:MAG: helix-turn-helix transcriptional regulator [Bacillota bacterium]
MPKIVNCIASIRKQKNISQEKLADILGITSRTLRKWENGKEYPKLDQAFLLAKILDIPIMKLFFYID